jgi:hypothetical protein
MDSYGVELAEVASRLQTARARASVRGQAAARFVFAERGLRSVEVHRDGQHWWVEFWDNEAAVADRAFPSAGQAVAAAAAWLAAGSAGVEGANGTSATSADRLRMLDK